MKEFIVFMLLLLASLSQGKPLERVKRAIIKDYFNPLTSQTDKQLFEKREDGKYHEQKRAGTVISAVEYVTADDIDDKNEIFGGTFKSSSTESPLSSGLSKVDSQNKNTDLSAKDVVAEKIKTEVKEENEEEISVLDKTAKLDSVTKVGDAASKQYKSSEKLDIPVDSKWSLVPKPDGKDDKPYEGGDEYFPEPTKSPEEKNDEGKVEIGEKSKHHPVFVPPNIPLFVPKRISFRVLTLLPKPPTIDISDRLPLPAPEVSEESEETVQIENISPSGDPTVLKEERRFIHHLISPLRLGLQLPFFSTEKALKVVEDEEKVKGLSKSEIVDIGGRKLLLQRKVLMSPQQDPRRMHISVMSIQPSHDEDTKILEELDKEKKELESEETELLKEMKFGDKREAEKRSVKGAEFDTSVAKEALHPKPVPQPKTSDTKVTGIKSVNAKISPIETTASSSIETGVEDAKKEVRGVTETKELELETKLKTEAAAEKSKKGSTALESGLKSEMHTETKFKEGRAEDKGMEILPIVPENKNDKTQTTTVIKEEKDILIGTEDLLHIKGEMKSHTPVSVYPLNTGVRAYGKKEKPGVEKGSRNKDEELAQSEIVEITLNPVKESERNTEGSTTEGKERDTEFKGISEILNIEPGDLVRVISEKKKGDEGVLNAKEVGSLHSGIEFRENKDSEQPTGILNAESEARKRNFTEEMKGNKGILCTEKVSASHSEAEFKAGKDANEQTDVLKVRTKDLEKNTAGAKKGDEGVFNAETDVASHFGTEFKKESTDNINAESKDFEETTTEAKKENGAMVHSKELAAPRSEAEFRTGKDTKEESSILKVESKDLEKALVEKKINAKRLNADGIVSSSGTEVTTSEDVKEKSDIMGIASKELQGDTKTEDKIEEVVNSSFSTKIAARKGAQGKSDI